MLDFFSDTDPLFEAEILSSIEGDRLEVMYSFSGILFILEGNATVSSMLSDNLLVEKGQMILLSSGRKYSLTCQSNFRSIIIQVPDIEMFCYHFFPSPVFHKQITFNTCQCLLPMGRHIELIIQDIESYILKNLSHPTLLKIKLLELFYFFSHSYSPDLLAHFFAPVLFADYIFSRFVLDHYRSVRTVEELADLSHYSLSGFQKQFRKVFGMAPYKWMTMKKTEKIYYEIHETTKPLKVIAEEAGFAGLSQLSDFCRKRLGKSPTAIRRQR